MRANSSTRFAAMALLFGALACAGNTAREADTDETAAARDTTTSDTLGGQANPSDRGMEGDSANAPQYPETSDTFLQNQGPGSAQDTAGYSGMERTDTTGQTDTTGAAGGARDSAGAWTADSAGQGQSANPSGLDTTGTSTSGDTTGYNPSQQPQSDTTTSR